MVRFTCEVLYGGKDCRDALEYSILGTGGDDSCGTTSTANFFDPLQSEFYNLSAWSDARSQHTCFICCPMAYVNTCALCVHRIATANRFGEDRIFAPSSINPFPKALRTSINCQHPSTKLSTQSLDL